LTRLPSLPPASASPAARAALPAGSKRAVLSSNKYRRRIQVRQMTQEFQFFDVSPSF